MITLAYITNRKQPMLHWFFDSLLHQSADVEMEVIVVDANAEEERDLIYKTLPYRVVKPLPSLVQGYHKVTKDNWFSASNARNTGLVHARGNFIMYIDDLSTCAETWLNGVVNAYRGGYVLEGAYRKDWNMVVEDGVLVSSVQKPEGMDSRWNQARGNKGYASWLFGCSVGMPVELALQVNGWEHLTDAIGYEDSLMGIRLQRAGARFVYDKSVLTIESSELHFTEGNFYKREDPETTQEQYFEILKRFGVEHSTFKHIHRYDASHALLDITYLSKENRCQGNNFDLKELRDKVQNGGVITLKDMKLPQVHWFTGKPFADM